MVKFVGRRRASMSAERTKVLEMLATGTLSVAQAGQLLEALDAGSPSYPASSAYERSQAAQPAAVGATVVLAGATAPGVSPQVGPIQFTLEQIIALSEHEIEPDFLKALVEAGLNDLSFEQIIALGEHEVDPHYIKDLRKAGLSDLSFEQIIALSEHEVDPDFIRRLRRAGLSDLSFEQIIALSEHEIDPDLIRRIREAGLPDLSFEQIL